MDKFPGIEVMKSNPEHGQAWHRAACMSLMKRAVENLDLFEKTAKDHAYFKGLYKRGFCSLKMWESVEAAFKAMNEDMHSVMRDASSLQQDWGKRIFCGSYEVQGDASSEAEGDAGSRNEEADGGCGCGEEEEEEAESKVAAARKEKKEELRRRKLQEELIREEEREKSKQEKKKESGKKSEKKKGMKKGFLL